MNKNLSQKVQLIFVLAIVVFVAIVFNFGRGLWDSYSLKRQQSDKTIQEHQQAEQAYNLLQEKNEKERMELESLKHVFETDLESNSENLSMFGNMFDEVLDNIKQNGLMLRSIEYQMAPEYDPLALNFAKEYNVCELKFFLVGTYDQLKHFMFEMTNNYPYLVSIPKVDVRTFSENDDYILAHLSVVLYSKHTNAEAKK